MGSAADRGVVEWLPWSGEAFERARTERRPVLLSIVAAWAPGCAEMDRCCYADPRTADAINATVVPIRVDADHRPDIADRYDLGGLPTTAFLSAGGALLGGGTFVSPDRLRAALEKVAGRADLCTGEASELKNPPTTGGASDADLEAAVFGAYDPLHGGFGSAPKFPLTAPIELAVDLYMERGATEMLECATRTLDALGWGPLYDGETGGFFRCACAADWSEPQRQRLLTTNASLLRTFVTAGGALEQDRWLERATDIVRYLNGTLTSTDGWPAADGLHQAARFSDGNAQAVSSMLHASAVTQDDETGRRVLQVLERVLLSSYRPGYGVGHAPGVRGLLTDQVAMAAANLDAWEATGSVVYRMMAEELMHYALRTMWDGERGGLLDRDLEADPREPLPQRGKPFVLNCDAAVVLQRLARAANEPMFAQRAAEILEAIRPAAARQGPIAAHYLLASRAVLR